MGEEEQREQRDNEAYEGKGEEREEGETRERLYAFE